MRELEKIIEELEGHIPSSSLINQKVSRGSVGWHISHTLLTMRVIIDALSSSKPELYKRGFNWKRLYVFTLNKIPRGKVRAPKQVQPQEEISEQTLKVQVQATREKLRILDDLSAGHYFTHPFLGNFKLRSALKFIKLHSNHHLHIIKDIIRSPASGNPDSNHSVGSSITQVNYP